MSRADAPLVEGLIVGYKWKALSKGIEIAPHVAKKSCIFSILHPYAVNLLCKVAEIIFGFRFHKFVKPVGNDAIHHLNSAYGADRGGLCICRLYIYCNEVIHAFTISLTCSISHLGVDVAPQIPIDFAPSTHSPSKSEGRETRKDLSLTLLHSL